MKVVAIIQARMGSTRLPGKVLKDLCGQSVLARVVQRTRGAKLVNELVVATSVLPADDAIARECERLSVGCFRGEEADVLDRYYRAAQQFGAEAVVRITADCPLIDPELIDSTIAEFLKERPDYATNSLVVTYPRGLDVEVFAFGALVEAWRSAKADYERVHVTPYLYEEPGRFRVLSLTADEDYSGNRWTLDTADDLELIREIFRHFAPNESMSWREVLELIKSRPELAEVNAHVMQKGLREG